jgi:hypothetical protein
MTVFASADVRGSTAAGRPIARVGLFVILLLVVAVVALGVRQAWSQPVTDDYILGFATSVLRHEFNVIGATLKVHNGVIWIHARDLQGINEDKLKRALDGIEGVNRVVISETEEPMASAAPDDTLEVKISEGTTGFLRRGLLFAPLRADPRWPQFSAAYRGYRTNDLTAAFAGNFGETFSLYRGEAPLNGQWELVLQAGVFSLFDLSAVSLDLVNADYNVGLLTSYRSGKFSGFLRLYHQSSHLGDEFLIENPGVQRINLSYEEVDVKFAYDVFSGVRVYAGTGYLVRRDPADLKPITTQWGIEWTSPVQYMSGTITPVWYANFESEERWQWAIARSILAGLRFENARIGNRQLLLLAHYFAGPSPDGQFFTQHANWYGIGFYFYF